MTVHRWYELSIDGDVGCIPFSVAQGTYDRLAQAKRVGEAIVTLFGYTVSVMSSDGVYCFKLCNCKKITTTRQHGVWSGSEPVVRIMHRHNVPHNRTTVKLARYVYGDVIA
jgi:hypothetical protein